MNIITFGKYKGMPVTRVLRIDPSYFGWCKNNVRWFRFSKRDYEIYLTWLSLQQNHLQFTGYSDDMEKKDGTYDNREVYVHGFPIKL